MTDFYSYVHSIMDGEAAEATGGAPDPRPRYEDFILE
jgi:hypothetical protein